MLAAQTTMQIERLQIDKRELLLDRLMGRVFHLTTRASYGEIKRAGEISNNQSGRYSINVGSQKSYGRLRGCVCLFDLRNNNSEVLQNTLNCYYFLGPSWFSKHGRKYITWDLAYLFLDQQYYNQLIPSSRVYDTYLETGQYLQAIPKSEVWLENRIPLSWIEQALLVKIQERVPDRNTPAGMHYWAVYKASELYNNRHVRKNR